MKIPKRFKLMGQTISVEYDAALFHSDSSHGIANFRHSKIVIQPKTEQSPVTQEHLEHTFFHELTHHIFYMVGGDEFTPPLHEKEYLVDRIAGLYHQAMTTMEYEE